MKKYCILFDDGWLFHRGEAPGGERPETDESTWRHLDLPHDWSIEDIPIPLVKVRALRGVWRFHRGDDLSWRAREVADSEWEKVRAPASWEDHSNYTQDKAYGWYRREIGIPPEFSGKDVYLDLGLIDDADETWFNGQKVGSTGSFPPDYASAWRTQRIYRLPKEIIDYGKPNTIAVRVYDDYGPGGLRFDSSSLPPEGPFEPLAWGGRDTGFTLGGVGWYRKHFDLAAAAAGGRVRIRFDGIYMNADIWLNGQRVGNHPYGYTSFWLDLTSHVHFGRENLLAVRVSNYGRNSRWYAGSGIYRSVWLHTTGPVHLADWGVAVTTPQVSADKALVRLRIEVRNASRDARAVVLRNTVTDRTGAVVARDESKGNIPADAVPAFERQVTVPRPSLWSPDNPALYEVKTEVLMDGDVTDEARTSFGIRSLSFDSERGFRLNGITTFLRGGCMHHDNGCLGAAAFPAAEERRVRLMKENGFNAIRTAHNPPSSWFLDACDRLGMLVIDEAFDHWEKPKNDHDYHRYFKDWWQRDLDSMVLRDRNHPSVIMWSIGNEIPERGTELGLRHAKALADRVRSHDKTRPVTEGVCKGKEDWKRFDPYFAIHDVAGYNYKADQYVPDHARVSRRVMYASESAPIEAFTHWMAVVDHPWVIGDFVWTGYDYIGEAAIGWYSWGDDGHEIYPWVLAYCGDIDLVGSKRPQSYYRDVLWGRGCRLSAFVHAPKPTFGPRERVFWGWDDVHASWNWPGQEFKPVRIEAYSVCEKVRLFLNGRDMGEKPTSRATSFKAKWEVPYEPGTVRLVGIDGGNETAMWELQTAGKPAKIRLTGDRDSIRADGRDLVFVMAEVVDKRGVRHPLAANLVWFETAGAGELVAVGSGNPRSTESFRKPQRKAFEGRCLAVVRAGRSPGTITLKAYSTGLASATIEIKVGGEQ